MAKVLIHNYVTDDPHSLGVILQYCRDRNWVDETPVNGCEHYEFAYPANEILEKMIKEGYLKLHLELGEYYYHPTDEGMEILKCQCGNSLFNDEEIRDKDYYE